MEIIFAKLLIIVFTATNVNAQFNNVDIPGLYGKDKSAIKRIHFGQGCNVLASNQGNGKLSTIEITLKKPLAIDEARKLVKNKYGIDVKFARVKKSMIGYRYGSLDAHSPAAVTKKIKLVNFIHPLRADKITRILICYNIGWKE